MAPRTHYQFPRGYRAGGGYTTNFAKLPRSASANVTVQPNMNSVTKLVRALNGTFKGGGWRNALADAHDQMSAGVRRAQVDVLTERRSKRTPRPTKYLEKSILDPRNSLVSAQGFQVGIVRWLSRSPAKMYWRRIEFGGPNPMAAQGRIWGHFWDGGGRLAWFHHPRGFRVHPVDVASEGYHYMRDGARRYLNSGQPARVYRDTFKAYGIRYIHVPARVGQMR
jgi:hypothetical protein